VSLDAIHMLVCSLPWVGDSLSLHCESWYVVFVYLFPHVDTYRWEFEVESRCNWDDDRVHSFTGSL
jgi:hypothetical protein